MSETMRGPLVPLLALTGVVWITAAALGVQGETGAQRVLRRTADSLRAETCRGGRWNPNGTCSGATAAPRVTVIRRLAARLDSVRATLTAPVVTEPVPTAPAGYDSTASVTTVITGTRLDSFTGMHLLFPPTMTREERAAVERFARAHANLPVRAPARPAP